MCLLTAGPDLVGSHALGEAEGTTCRHPRGVHPLLVLINPQKSASSWQTPCSNAAEAQGAFFCWVVWVCDLRFPSPVPWARTPEVQDAEAVASLMGCPQHPRWRADAAGHSCTLSADSDKEGAMVLIPEGEKTSYQQGHERGNRTAAPSPAFLPGCD